MADVTSDEPSVEPRSGLTTVSAEVVVADTAVPVTAVCFVNAGRVLCVGQGRFLKLYDVETGEMIAHYPVLPEEAVHGVVEVGGGLMVVYGGKQVALVQIGSSSSPSSSRSTGSNLVVTKLPQRSAWVFDVAVGAADAPAGGDASSSSSSTLHHLVVALGHNSVEQLEVAPDGSTTVTSSAACSRRCMLFSAAVHVGGPFIRVAAGTVFNHILVWDGSSGTVLHRLVGHAGVVFKVDWSEDGVDLLSAGDGRSVRFWDGVGEVSSTSAATASAAASAADDAPATAAEAAAEAAAAAGAPAPERTATWMSYGHRSRLWECKFVPGSDVVLSSAEDATVRLWNRSSGKPLAVLDGHRGKHVWCCAVHPTSTIIASGGGDALVKLWSVPGELRRHEAQATPSRFPLPSHDLSEHSSGGAPVVIAGLHLLPGGETVVVAASSGPVWRMAVDSGDCEVVVHLGVDGNTLPSKSQLKTVRAGPTRAHILVSRIDGHLVVVAVDGPRDEWGVLCDWKAHGRTVQGVFWDVGGGGSGSGSESPTELFTASEDRTVKRWRFDGGLGTAPTPVATYTFTNNLRPMSVYLHKPLGAVLVGGAVGGRVAVARLAGGGGGGAGAGAGAGADATADGSGPDDGPGISPPTIPADFDLRIADTDRKRIGTISPGPPGTNILALLGGSVGRVLYVEVFRRDGSGDGPLCLRACGLDFSRPIAVPCRAFPSPHCRSTLRASSGVVTGWQNTMLIVQDIDPCGRFEHLRVAASGPVRPSDVLVERPDGSPFQSFTVAVSLMADRWPVVGLVRLPVPPTPFPLRRRVLGMPCLGLTGRDIAWGVLPSHPDRRLLFVAGEDKEVLMYSVHPDTMTLQDPVGLNGHTASARALAFLALPGDSPAALVVTAGGNQLLLLWHIDLSGPFPIPTLRCSFQEGDGGDTTQRIAGAVLVRGPASSAASVSASASASSCPVYLAVGNSCGVLSVIRVADELDRMTRVAQCRVTDKPVFALEAVTAPSCPASTLLVIGASDGSLAVVDASPALGLDGSAPELDALPVMHSSVVHAMGCNALSCSVLDDSRVLVVSGGDDQSVAASVVTVTPDAGTRAVESVAVTSVLYPGIAAAGVTAVYAGPSFALCCGNDQRLTLFAVDKQDDGVRLTFQRQWCSQVADVAGLAVTPWGESESSSSSSFGVAVGGQGIELLNLKLA